MMLVGLVLLGVGVADLVAGGLSGVPQTRDRGLGGLAVGSITAVLFGLVAGFDGAGLVAAAFLAVFGGASWIGIRLATPVGEGRARAALLALGVTVAVAMGAGGSWQGRSDRLVDWLERLPFAVLRDVGAEGFVLSVGILVFLTASSNGVVRGVLAAAGTEVERSSQRLRGGRVIGVIERLLIFGLAGAGHLTAASIIVSAKSILRFPELSKAARENGITVPGRPEADRGPAEVDLITEYFLLGSMTSWILALAPAALLP